MIKILLLEDSSKRISDFHARFREYGKPFRIWQTDQADQAIGMLQTLEFDLVFLDHDLKPEHYMSSFVGEYYPDTGLNVASFLHDNPDVAKKHGRYFVHSLNEVGRKAMYDRIKLAGVFCKEAPFCWSKDKFLEYCI